MDGLLRFFEHDFHIIGLAWMAAVYGLRTIQFARLPWPGDRAPRRGSPGRGVMAAYAAAFVPWSTEGNRKHPWRWLEFAVYHLGAAAAIATTFMLSFAPGVLTSPVRHTLAVIAAAAAAAGAVKIIRRLSRPELRLISVPDDYFSLAGVEAFLVATTIVLLAQSTPARMAFFIITGCYLIYVPLSKVSHYVYYFLAALVTGARYGLRGARPAPRRPA